MPKCGLPHHAPLPDRVLAWPKSRKGAKSAFRQFMAALRIAFSTRFAHCDASGSRPCRLFHRRGTAGSRSGVSAYRPWPRLDRICTRQVLPARQAMRTHLENVGSGLAFILDCLRRRLFSVQTEQTAANFVVGHDRLPSWLKVTRSVIRANSTFSLQFPTAKQSLEMPKRSRHNQSKNCATLIAKR